MRRRLLARFYWERVVEARGVLLIGVLVLAAFSLVVYGMTQKYGPEGDVWGSSSSTDPGVICSKHGVGATVCSPAPPGVERYREERKAERDAAK